MRVATSICVSVVLLASPVQASDCRFDLYQVKDAGLPAETPLAKAPGSADGLPSGQGTLLPAANQAPYSAFRRLDSLVNGANRYCTAQFVDRDMLLTAAHCVRDNGNGAWADIFELREIGAADAKPVSDPKCIVTPRGWVGKMPKPLGQSRFYWPDDYALVVLKQPMSDHVLNIGVGAEGTSVQAMGLPVEIGSHDKLIAAPGKLEIEPVHSGFGAAVALEKNATLGMSGGAWLVNPSATAQDGANMVVGLSTTISRDDNNVFFAGPRFEQCAIEMVAFVRSECK